MKRFLLVFVVLLASAASFANLAPQEQGQDSEVTIGRQTSSNTQGVGAVDKDGYFNLNVDPFVPGGVQGWELGDAKLGKGEKIPLSFNYDLKLTLLFKAKNGKQYQRTGKLRAGQEIIFDVIKSWDDGKKPGYLKVLAEAWLVQHCGNPFPGEGRMQMTLYVPIAKRDRFRFKPVEVAILKPELYGIPQTEYLPQIQRIPGDIYLKVERKRQKWELVETSRIEAEERWEYRKDFWDIFTGLLGAGAPVLAEMVRKSDNVTATAETSSAASAASSSSASASASQSQAQGQQQNNGGKGGGEEPQPEAEVQNLLVRLISRASPASNPGSLSEVSYDPFTLQLVVPLSGHPGNYFCSLSN